MDLILGDRLIKMKKLGFGSSGSTSSSQSSMSSMYGGRTQSIYTNNKRFEHQCNDQNRNPFHAIANVFYEKETGHQSEDLQNDGQYNGELCHVRIEEGRLFPKIVVTGEIGNFSEFCKPMFLEFGTHKSSTIRERMHYVRLQFRQYYIRFDFKFSFIAEKLALRIQDEFLEDKSHAKFHGFDHYSARKRNGNTPVNCPSIQNRTIGSPHTPGHTPNRRVLRSSTSFSSPTAAASAESDIQKLRGTNKRLSRSVYKNESSLGSPTIVPQKNGKKTVSAVVKNQQLKMNNTHPAINSRSKRITLRTSPRAKGNERISEKSFSQEKMSQGHSKSWRFLRSSAIFASPTAAAAVQLNIQKLQGTNKRLSKSVYKNESFLGSPTIVPQKNGKKTVPAVKNQQLKMNNNTNPAINRRSKRITLHAKQNGRISEESFSQEEMSQGHNSSGYLLRSSKISANINEPEFKTSPLTRNKTKNVTLLGETSVVPQENGKKKKHSSSAAKREPDNTQPAIINKSKRPAPLSSLSTKVNQNREMKRRKLSSGSDFFSSQNVRILRSGSQESKCSFLALTTTKQIVEQKDL